MKTSTGLVLTGWLLLAGTEVLAQAPPAGEIKLPPGMRAVALRLPGENNTTAASLVPGAHVDIFQMTKKDSAVTGEYLMRDVLVVAADTRKAPRGRPDIVVVTVAVNAEHAARLATAARTGTLRLLLVPPRDPRGK